MGNLLKDASILLTPTAYDNGRMLAVKPSDNLYGTELITNGDFTNGVNGWQGTDAASLLSVVLGELKIENGDGSAAGANSSITTEIGKKYRITFVSNKGSAINGIFFGAGTSTNTVNLLNVTDNFDGIHTGTFTATTTTSWFIAKTLSTVNGQFSYIDNVSVKEDLSGDFQFSRNSAATRVNAQGLVENVQILSSNLVSNGDFSQEGVQEVSNGSFSQESSELVVNGDFSSDTAWTKLGNWVIENGKLTTDGGASLVYQSITSAINKTYKVTFEVSNYVSGEVTVGFGGALINPRGEYVSDNGVYTQYLTKTDTNQSFGIRPNNFIGSIDNVSVKEVGQDWALTSSGDSSSNVIIDNGSCQIISDGTLTGLTQTLVTTIGKTYKCTINISSVNNVGGGIAISNGNVFASSIATFTTAEIHTFYFKATSTSVSIKRASGLGGSIDYTIDNISVKEVGQDWSITGTGWNISDNGLSGLAAEQNVEQPISTIVGKKYVIKFTISNWVSGDVYVRPDNSGGTQFYVNGNGTYTEEFTGVSSSLVIRARPSVPFSGTVSNISLIEITNDTNLPRINYEGFSYQDSLGSEEVVNGDFATDSNWVKQAAWSISGGTANSNGSNGSLYQNSVVEIGKSYLCEFEITSITSGSVAINAGGNTTGTSRTSIGKYSEKLYVVSGSNDRAYIISQSFNGSIDNVSFKEVLGQEVVPDSGCGSWLLEPQSTNLVTQSENFSSGWTLSNASIVSNSVISPDGNLNATLLKGNTNLSNHNIRRSGLNASFTGTYSVFAKAKELRYLQIASINTTNQYVNFDLQDGLVGTVGSNFSDAKIEDYGNGWYKLSVTSDDRYNSFYLSLVPETNSSWLKSWEMSNSTDGLYIWGAQLEQSSFATSYIPTSGAISTRLQDIATNSGNASLINSESGVLYAEFSLLSQDYVSERSIALQGQGQNCRIRFLIDGTLRWTLIGNNTTIARSLTITNTNINKVAIRYSSTSASIWINGLLADTSLNGMTYTALDEITMNGFYSKTKALAVYKTALTDASLRCLTYPPAVATTFDLNFNTIAEQFTFTRGSEATFVNAQGLIQSTNEIGSELVTNGSFDTDSNWGGVGSNGFSISGGKLILTDVPYARSVSQGNVTTLGKTYKVTFEISDYVKGSVRVYLGGSVTPTQTSNGTFTSYVVASANTAVGIQTFDGGGTTLSIDNVSVKELTTATNTPRLDYSTGSEAFLLEPQSTNLITQSEDFSDSSWSKSNCIIGSEAVSSPSGVIGVSNVTNTSLFGRLSTIKNLNIGISYTYSFWSKNIDTTTPLSIYLNASGIALDTFTPTSKWVRYQFTWTSSSTITETIAIQDRIGTALGSYMIWGAQLEQQSYATSYIPTSGASATRNQELCNNATPVINSEEGTLYAEISALANTDIGDRTISLSDGSTTNRLELKLSSTGSIQGRFDSASSDITLTKTGIDTSNNNKIVLVWSNGKCALWINGVKEQENLAFNTFSSNVLSDLSFYSVFSGGSNNFYGNTKGLKYYPKALADVQLQDLTSWGSFTEMANALNYTIK